MKTKHSLAALMVLVFLGVTCAHPSVSATGDFLGVSLWAKTIQKKTLCVKMCQSLDVWFVS